LISVNLSVRSGLKKIIKSDSVKIELPEDSDFTELAEKICGIYGTEVRNLLFSEKYGFIWLCVRNRKRVHPDEVLEDGDEIMLLPPLAGG
jgi:molybdopterin converting factor small subunit